MQLTTFTNFPTRRIFWLFMITHMLCWTLAPYLVRYNLPMDALEGNLWGHQLAWGYDKNPYLNAWLTALAVYLGNYADWVIYLFSQLSVAACFWAVWKIARRMLPPIYALFSVMILESVQYFNFHAIDFNDNTLELSLWALCAYFFYEALCLALGANPRGPVSIDNFSCSQAPREKLSTLPPLGPTAKQIALLKYWALTGLFAGLGLMAKYYTLVLLAGMALFLLLNKNNRRVFLSPALYVGLLTMFIVILPHILWLFSHDFITITYVFDRAASAPTWINHFFFPAQFAWQQFEVFMPALIVFALLFLGKRPLLAQSQSTISTFNQQFLFYVAIMPFLLTIVLSLLTGTKLRAGWGMPLLSLWGIILFALLQPRLSLIKIFSFIAGIFALMATLIGGYSYSLIYSKDPSSANFPGREMAQSITNEWHKRYHTKLMYVAGSRWLCSNVVYYSPDHPAAFTEWDNKRSFWIDVNEMKKQGAIFIWDISNNESLPANIAKQFPRLSATTTMTFAYHRNPALPAINVGVAFLPAS